MTSRKVAVVTGSNKGIGYVTVKELCEKFDGDVYLTSRDVKRGQEAVEKLKALGHSVLFHQLDVTDQKSVDNFRDHIKNKHGGLDILINNAGIAFQGDTTEPISIQAEETIQINYYGIIRVCDALFPLLRQNGRVINLSSSVGHLTFIPSADLRARFHHENLTIAELDKLMDEFVQDAKNGTYEKKWGTFYVAYVVSKVGVSCLSFIQQRLLDAEKPNRNISVNSVHPGFFVTDLTRHAREERHDALPVEESAKAPIFLALEADLKGQFVWEDCRVVDWYATNIDDLLGKKD